MKNIIKILFILFFYFFTVFIVNWNGDDPRDRDWDPGPGLWDTPECRAEIDSSISMNLTTNTSFAANCDSEQRSKSAYVDKPYTSYPQVRAESMSWLSCTSRPGWFNCVATCWNEIINEEWLIKIVRPTFLTISKNNLFSWAPIELSQDLRQPVNLELVMSFWNILNISEANRRFKWVFSHTYNYTSNCYVTCKQESYDIFLWLDDKWEPRFYTVYYQTSSRTCNPPVLTTPTTPPTPTIKVWTIPPEIKVKIKDDNCVQDWEWYSCYASEWFNFELEVVKQWNPSPVDSVKSYVLNYWRTGCADWGPAWSCEEFNISTWWWEFRIDSKDFKKAWDYSIEFSWLVHVWWSVVNISQLHYVDIKIVPNPDWLVWESVAESGGDAFANFEDFYKYDITIKDKYWNPIKSKKIVDLACTSDCIPDLSWKDWIHISGFDKNPNWEWWENIFRIVSAVPSTKWAKPIFDWKLKKWDQKYNDIEDEETWFKIETESPKTFEEPILLRVDWIEVEWWNLDVSKSQKYRIWLENPWRLKDYRNGRVFPFNPSSIVLTDSSSYEFEWNSFKEVNENFGSDINNWFWDVNTILSWTKLTFKAVIKALKDVAILEKARIEVRDLSISYNLLKNGKSYSIWYKLSTSGVLEWCKRVTTWLMVNWISQWSWKLSYTSEVNTFANSSKLDFKQAVRKNVANLTRNLTSWTKINSIYFVDLSKSANKDLKFSTIKSKLAKNDNLILKWWNLVIDTDVNDSIWIVVSADNFDVESNREIWNIYVTKNVKKINAFIYADWWFISWQWTWKARYTDEELRENKLDLQWSLFTSNTIWGSEKWENYCRLPGDRKTTDCELAKLYDLNYIRMHILCKKEDYSFKIEYNPSIQLNPPKVFIIR